MAVAVLETLPARATPPEHDLTDRRRLIRVPCDLPVFCMGLDRDRFFRARVRDAGLGGLRLELYDSFLVPGERLKIKPGKGAISLTVRVVWSRSEPVPQVGVKFEDLPTRIGRSWVLSLLRPLGPRSNGVNRRKLLRVATKVFGTARLKSGETAAVTCLDLGLTGARLACDRSLAPSTRMLLELGPLGESGVLDLHAQVLSSGPTEDGGFRCSVRFTELSSRQTRLLGRTVVHLLKTASA